MPNISIKFKATTSSNDDITITPELLDNVNSLSQMTSDASTIEYGGLANSGSIDIIDNGDYIADLIEDGTLPTANIPVEIYLGDKLIQKHITTDSSYDTDSKEFTTSLSNDIEKFGKLKYQGYDYPNESRNAYEMLFDVMAHYYGGTLLNTKYSNFLRNLYNAIFGLSANYLTDDQIYDAVGNQIETSTDRELTEHSIEGLYIQILGSTPSDTMTEEQMAQAIGQALGIGGTVTFPTDWNFDDMLSDTIIYGSTNEFGHIYDYMKGITIPYPIIESNQTYIDVINSFCTLVQLHFYINDDGNAMFSSARPMLPLSGAYSNDYIVIPESCLEEPFTRDLVLKNKYDGVEVTETSVNDETDIDSLLYTWKSSTSDYTTSGDNDSDNNQNNLVQCYARVTTSYYSGTMIFPKISNQNLNQIISVNDKTQENGEYRIKYSINYIHQTGGVQAPQNFPAGMFFLNPNYTETTEGFGEIRPRDDEGNILYNIDASFDIYGVSVNASLPDETNLGTLNVEEDENNYIINFKVLIGYTKISGSMLNDASSSTTGTSEAYYMKEGSSLDVSAYGIKRTISFTDVTNSTDNISTALTVSDISGGGRLLQTGTNYNGTKVSDLIKNNIISDYESGIKTASVTISGVNYYNNTGELVKNWKNGEIIQPNEVVAVEKQNYKNGSPITWRVTGREFNWDGEPLTTLELMEARKTYPLLSYTYNSSENGYSVYSVSDEISGNISIPSTYDDGVHGELNVTSIAIQGFRNKTDITGITIPSTIKTIGSQAFENTGLTSITIPSSVTSIGSSAFSGTKITSITIPNTVLGSLYYICQNCQQLTTAIIGSGVTAIYNIFQGCNNLQSVTLSSGLLTIGEYSFSGCSNLSSITIPNTVTTIGMNAFAGCLGLSEIDIPSSVTTIAGNQSAGPFWNCSSSLVINCNVYSKPDDWGQYWNYYSLNGKLQTNWLSPIQFTAVSGGYQVAGLASGVTNLHTLIIPDTYNGQPVVSIAESAFEGNLDLLSVTIGSNITSIGNNAFWHCAHLVEVCNLSDLSITKGSQDNGNVGTYALDIYTTSNFTSKIIYVNDDFVFRFDAEAYNPSDPTSADYTFVGYIGASSSITLPAVPYNYTYKINQFAFAYDTSITSVDLGIYATEIGANAFAENTAITNIKIGNSVTTINAGAFSDCTSLETIYIPSSVTTIDASFWTDSPFFHCSGLVIYCGASSKPSGWGNYWNYSLINNVLTVKWSYTYEQYLAEIS